MRRPLQVISTICLVATTITGIASWPEDVQNVGTVMSAHLWMSVAAFFLSGVLVLLVIVSWLPDKEWNKLLMFCLHSARERRFQEVRKGIEYLASEGRLVKVSTIAMTESMPGQVHVKDAAMFKAWIDRVGAYFVRHCNSAAMAGTILRYVGHKGVRDAEFLECVELYVQGVEEIAKTLRLEDVNLVPVSEERVAEATARFEAEYERARGPEQQPFMWKPD